MGKRRLKTRAALLSVVLIISIGVVWASLSGCEDKPTDIKEVEQDLKLGLFARPLLADPCTYFLANPAGDTIEFYGDRDSDGYPVNIKMIRVVNKGTSSFEVDYGEDSRPSSIRGFSEKHLVFKWVSDSSGYMYVKALDGTVDTVVAFDLAEGTRSLEPNEQAPELAGVEDKEFFRSIQANEAAGGQTVDIELRCTGHSSYSPTTRNWSGANVAALVKYKYVGLLETNVIGLRVPARHKRSQDGVGYFEVTLSDRPGQAAYLDRYCEMIHGTAPREEVCFLAGVSTMVCASTFIGNAPGLGACFDIPSQATSVVCVAFDVAELVCEWHETPGGRLNPLKSVSFEVTVEQTCDGDVSERKPFSSWTDGSGFRVHSPVRFRLPLSDVDCGECPEGFTGSNDDCPCDCDPECRENLELNPSTCKCECLREDRECPEGWAFDEQFCECLCDREDEECTEDPSKPHINLETCECDCVIDQDYCSQFHQRFDPTICDCVCDDVGEECDEPGSGMVINAACQCVCERKGEPCEEGRTNKVFDEFCDCVCENADDPCPEGQTRDSETCECVPDEPKKPEDNSTGDVHLATADGLVYDFQGAGEYLLVESSDGSIVVQARQEPWLSSRKASVNTAIAMYVDGDTVGIYVNSAPSVYVNNQPIQLMDNRFDLSNGGAVFESSKGGRNLYLILWPDGTVAGVTDYGRFLNFGIEISPSYGGSLSGLLGNFNGNPDDDVTTKNGDVLIEPIDFDSLYYQFGDSWRISQEESLFRYAADSSTLTYTIANFPERPIRLKDLDPEVRAHAEGICRAQGLDNGWRFENCVLDVAITGDDSFAAANSNSMESGRRAIVIDPEYFDNWIVVDTLGKWSVGSTARSVEQGINGNPTLFVSPGEYIDTRITGRFRVETSYDDDLVGFVIGLKSPIELGHDNYEFVLFDWKQRAQRTGENNRYYWPAGFALTRIDATFETEAEFFEGFWNHNGPGVTVLAMDTGQAMGWIDRTEYAFELEYTRTRVRVKIDENVIFDVQGDFEPGRFGFYNFSQEKVRYYDFKSSLLE